MFSQLEGWVLDSGSVYTGAQKTTQNIRILHYGSKDQYSIRGIPETMVGRILTFMWPFGALLHLGKFF